MRWIFRNEHSPPMPDTVSRWAGQLEISELLTRFLWQRGLHDPDSMRIFLNPALRGLARYLRLYGFDAWYQNDASDDALAALYAAERRMLLTRDVGLLNRRSVTRGYFVRARRPREQLE